MQIKDYELVNNIDVLFEKKIIIYGAGKYGCRSAILLEKAGVEIYCFCDRDAEQNHYQDYRIITPDELEITVQKEDCMIVVGSRDYCDEIIEELVRRKVKAYICTWYGLQAAIEINLDDGRFLKAFQETFKRKKELFSMLDTYRHGKSALITMCQISSAILVYQPGKVGSVTVRDTLQREGLDVIHFHRMCVFPDEVAEKAVMEEASTFFRKQIRTEGCKIITLVRDPIARALSSFMQGGSDNDIYMRWDFSSGCSLAAYVAERIVGILDNNFEFDWFDRELKEATGIDIYQYPFDKEKGYAWIKEGNIEILVLKLEKLNDNTEVLGEFVGRPGIKLQVGNVGDKKQYKYIYEGLKRDLRIPARVVESQYKNNPQMDHFYTEEEKERFMQKWSRYVTDEEDNHIMRF